MKQWMFWQVGLPIVGPIGLSAIAAMLWQTGARTFRPRIAVILDVTPWALVFFALTLVGSTLSVVAPKYSTLPGYAWSLGFTALAACLYAAFMVIWRHDPTFSPGAPVYAVAIVLSAAAVVISYIGYKKAGI